MHWLQRGWLLPRRCRRPVLHLQELLKQPRLRHLYGHEQILQRRCLRCRLLPRLLFYPGTFPSVNTICSELTTPRSAAPRAPPQARAARPHQHRPPTLTRSTQPPSSSSNPSKASAQTPTPSTATRPSAMATTALNAATAPPSPTPSPSLKPKRSSRKTSSSTRTACASSPTPVS